MRLPVDNEIMPSTSTHKSADEYIEKMIAKLDLLRKIAKENIEESQNRNKEIYDRNSRTFSYKPGDKCWLYIPKVAGAQSKKLSTKWRGPYLVIRQTGPSNYVLADCATKREISYPVNVSRMKPFNDNRDLFHTYDIQGKTQTQDQSQSNPSTQQTQPSTSRTDSSNQQITNPPSQIHIDNPTAREKWDEAKEINGVKTVNGKKYYHIIWADSNQQPSWVEDKYVGEGLKTKFYVTHTSRGTRRHNYRHLQQV